MRNEKVTFVCMSTPRLGNLERMLPRILPYVDQALIVIGRKDQEAITYLKSLGPKVKIVYRQWTDNFMEQWSVWTHHVKEGWVLLLDDDEVPSIELLASLDVYVNTAEKGEKHSCIEFRANPVSEGQDLGPANYWRQVFFRVVPGMHYRGGTKTGCHQYLVGYQNNRIVRSNHVYYHIKSLREEYRNAARNYFIYGIWKHGSTDGEQRDEWKELRDIVERRYPEVKTFMELDDVFIKGKVHPEMTEWMIKYYVKYKEHPEYNEMRAFCLYYMRHLHPEEAPVTGLFQ